MAIWIIPAVLFGVVLGRDEITGKSFKVGPDVYRVTSGAAVSIIRY
jgi:hypothetical protein